jgi:DNA-binding winged helix-turn-helix (wHTH) protein
VRFRFGQFTLDDEARQLLRGAEEVHLSPKAFELLKALVEARPRALSKTDLRELLWPDTFVTEANLAILIKEIRSALNDNARAPHFVRTLHRFGYAFSGSVVETAAAPRAESYWLVWRERKFALAEGENLVGRSPEAAVWLDVPGVSREHARVAITGGAATLEDLGSRNGTFRAGERVTAPVALRDRDQIQLGPVLMRFRMWSPGAGTQTEDLNDSASPANRSPR